MELIELLEDEAYSSLYYVTDPSWTFGLNGDDHQFGVAFEIMNMYEATGEEEFEHFPYVVEASIVAHDAHPGFTEGAGEDPDEVGWTGRIYDAFHEVSGVPIMHIVHDEMSTERSEGLEALLDGLRYNEYMVIEKETEFGTVAAQRGRGASFAYPRFRTHKAALTYVENIVKSGRLDALPVMIGFILDRPINMMGETGWKTVTMWVKGPDYRGNPSTEPLRADAVFRARTQGGKYKIDVFKSGRKYDARFYTSGKETGRASGYTKQQMRERIRDVVRDEKEIDGRTYLVMFDDLGIEELLNNPSPSSKKLKSKLLR